MIGAMLLGIGLIVGLEPGAQAGAAKEAKPDVAGAVPPRPPEKARVPDFKVVFWFDRVGIRHQVYDLRKGQYTQAVDDWVNRVEYDASGFVLPGHLATVRTVFLDPASPKPESEQLAEAIARQEQRILGRGGSGSSSFGSAYRPVPRVMRDRPARSLLDSRLRLGGDASLRPFFGNLPANSPGPLYPQPVPYSRPHP
ncbi:hypothetical protein ACYOEI_16350 [Singulisphaera rosea]